MHGDSGEDWDGMEWKGNAKIKCYHKKKQLSGVVLIFGLGGHGEVYEFCG